MGRPAKPYALVELENRKHDVSRAKAKGRDVNAAVQAQGLTQLDADEAIKAWGTLRTSADFFRALSREFGGLAFYYQPDFAVLGLAADALERYHAFQDAYRKETDMEQKLLIAGAINREVRTFVSLSAKLGLDPASRDKFMLHHSLRKALDEGETFDW